jgi:hypothetical protein
MHFIHTAPKDPVGHVLVLDEISSHALDATIEETDISSKILDIVFEYALNKFSDTMERLGAGKSKFLSIIGQFIVAQKRQLTQQMSL